MKTAAIIVSAIFLLGTAAMGFMGSNRSIKDAKTIDQAQKALKGMSAKNAPKSVQQIKAISPSRLRAGGVAFALVGLLSLALLVVVLMKRGIVPHLAIGVIATAAFAVALNPSYDLGPTAPASARTLAYVVGVLAALGAAAAFGARSPETTPA